MKNLLILVALLIIGTINLLAQKQVNNDAASKDQYYPVAFNISFLAGMPQGEFEDNNNKTGFGIGADLFYNVENTPIYIGGKFGFMSFASETDERPWSTTIPDLRVDVTTDYQMYNMDFGIKLMPDWGPIRPYVEMMAGFNNLSTTTTVEDINSNNEDNNIASSDDKSDWTYNYGVGGGIAFNVYRGQLEDNSRFWELLIDLNANYLLGGTAQYIVPKSKQVSDGTVSYEEATSKTDLLAIRMGVTFRF